MKQLLIYTFLVLLLFPTSVWAQSSVNVRSGAHESYSRIVFDWGQATEFTVTQKSSDSVSVSFNSTSQLNLDKVNTTSLRNVKAINYVQEDNKVLVTFEVLPGSKLRYFNVGLRVVLDFYYPNNEMMAETNITQTNSESIEDKKRSDKQEISKIEPEVVNEEPPPLNSQSVAQENTRAKTAQDILDQAEEFEANVITVSLTETANLASFVRGETLWIVLDKKNIKVPPQIAGPNEDIFPEFTRTEVNNGVVFSMKLPKGTGYFVYGEGGGLLWRLVLSPKLRKQQYKSPQRRFVNNAEDRGGAVLWPFTGQTSIVEVFDPSVGDTLKVVTVEQANQSAGLSRRFVDFSTLLSPIGLTIHPWVDDLTVESTPEGVIISSSEGLAISRDKDVSIRQIRENVVEVNVTLPATTDDGQLRRIFDFDRWMMGGIRSLHDNQHIIMVNMASKETTGKVQDLLTLAKMSLANDRGQEAIGFLYYAERLMPGITEGPEYLALRGAARAMAGKYELAFIDFMHPALRPYGELDYWRSFSLAWLEDWQQARRILPKDYSILIQYPLPLLQKIGLKLAEVALRNGDVEMSESILAVLQKDRDSLEAETLSGMAYLKGEAHRQSDEIDRAIELWTPLTEGEDELYRTKSGLALTLLELDLKQISSDKAIDRLEGMRYMWRGDELEAQVNFTLGRLYIDKGKYLKGLSILRDAASMSPNSDIGKEIALFMSSEFYRLLTQEDNLSPIDVVTIYEEFRELTPSGDEGNILIQKLAERLVEADLLERATKLLGHQVDFRLKGIEKGNAATRLAAIHILDKEPGQALKALDVAKDVFKAHNTNPISNSKIKEVELLKARALSDMNRTEEAIRLLNTFAPTPEVNQLRADIAWQAGLWEDAAEALNDMILDQAIDLSSPLTDRQSELLLHQAVSLNLSGNRVELANMRKKYGDAMKRTQRARLFEVVTRPRKNTLLSDRETLSALVDEVDIFRDFLETYKTTNTISN
jgi:tetratricopeptide (TPR) repeat protein